MQWKITSTARRALNLPSRGNSISRFLWYLAMGPLEIYGRVSGRYRSREPLPPYPIYHSPAGPGPIVAFGDSLTAGFGAAAEASYPVQLSKILGRTIINAGVNGDTSRDGLARLQAEVLAVAPAVVLIGFGGNDMIQGRRIEECFECLGEMIERVQAGGALVLLVGIRGSWLYKLDYDIHFRELAVRTGCLLVPSVLDGIWGVPWLMRDVAHPNAWGYRKIARRIADVLLPHLHSDKDDSKEHL